MVGYIIGGIGLVAIVGGIVVFASSRSDSRAPATDPSANVPGTPRDDGARVASEALGLANTIAGTIRDAVQRNADGGARDKLRLTEETPRGREG